MFITYLLYLKSLFTGGLLYLSRCHLDITGTVLQSADQGGSANGYCIFVVGILVLWRLTVILLLKGQI